jgi:hypothetical protein
VRLWLSVIATSWGISEEGWELVADEFAAALGEDRWTAGETCALLLAAAGRRASHAGASWQHAEKDRGAAAAEGLAKQGRQRIERSEAIQGGGVSGARRVGGERQTKQVSETAKRAAMRPEGSYVDLSLTPEGA